MGEQRGRGQEQEGVTETKPSRFSTASLRLGVMLFLRQTSVWKQEQW